MGAPTAMGHVGMEENALLGEFFNCLSYVPLTSTRYPNPNGIRFDFPGRNLLTRGSFFFCVPRFGSYLPLVLKNVPQDFRRPSRSLFSQKDGASLSEVHSRVGCPSVTTDDAIRVFHFAWTAQRDSGGNRKHHVLSESRSTPRTWCIHGWCRRRQPLITDRWQSPRGWHRGR